MEAAECRFYVVLVDGGSFDTGGDVIRGVLFSSLQICPEAQRALNRMNSRLQANPWQSYYASANNDFQSIVVLHSARNSK